MAKSLVGNLHNLRLLLADRCRKGYNILGRWSDNASTAQRQTKWLTAFDFAKKILERNQKTNTPTVLRKFFGKFHKTFNQNMSELSEDRISFVSLP